MRSLVRIQAELCSDLQAFRHGDRRGQDWSAKVRAFIEDYNYSPTFDLRDTAEELYAEVGSIAVTLINEKIKRAWKNMLSVRCLKDCPHKSRTSVRMDTQDSLLARG